MNNAPLPGSAARLPGWRVGRAGWIGALPIALMTLIPVMTVIGSALSPQPEVWQHCHG